MYATNILEPFSRQHLEPVVGKIDLPEHTNADRLANFIQ
jgi:hypothetical protein